MFGHSIISLTVSLIILVSGVRLEERGLLEVLDDVKPRLEQLLAPTERQHFNLLYHEAYGLLEGLNFGELYQDLNEGTHDNQTCRLCDKLISLAKGLLQSPEIILTFGKPLCESQNLYPERVCVGLVERMAGPVVYMLQNTKLDQTEVCAMLLHPDCMTHLGKPMTHEIMWKLDIPEKNTSFKPIAVGGSKPMKMLHFSDFHIDLFYTVGANADCNEPLCCRSTSFGHNQSAGPWGDLNGNCDSAPNFVVNTIEQMHRQHNDIDFIVWTGDSSAHDVWNTSREINLRSLKTISQKIHKEFKDVPVLASLGNHEAHPINLFIPSDVPQTYNSMSWLYETVADDVWSQWIGKESRKTFKKGGYYSALIRPNLKVVVLNTNICDRENYWIAYSPFDPDGQLKWLIDQLGDAESRGISVMMLGHVPPSNCYLSWFSNYLAIVNRYREVIAGLYFGHTHKEEVLVYYEQSKSGDQPYPVIPVYIAGSITTYSALNPSYRIYELDASGRPQDFTTYYTDLKDDDTNGANKEPVWQTLYSAKECYRMTDLSTGSWDQFINQTLTDDRLTELYYRNFHRNSSTYVRSNPGNSLKWQHDNIAKNKVINPITQMLPPI